jgi:putrescine transport system permease protein
MATSKNRGRSWGRWLVVAIPYAWLLVLFLIPFLIVVKISFSTSAIAQPPYFPSFDLTAGLADFIDQAKQFVSDNYVFLTQDSLYWRAYLSSLWIAGASTFLVLLVGYPMAYGMARAPRA